MLKAVIFDCDGVLADSEAMHYEAFAQVLADVDVLLTRQDYDRHYLGYVDGECLSTAARAGGLELDERKLVELVEKKKRLFSERMRSQDTVFPGAAALVRELTGQVRLAVCSGALRHEIETLIEPAGLAELFETIVAADDCQQGKPDPEGYRLALTRLNENHSDKPLIQPGETLAIEDSGWGIDAAHEAGMWCLAVATSYPADQLTRADRVVETLDGVRWNHLCEWF